MDVTQRVSRIIAEIFDLPIEDITLRSGPENIAGWDSFGQMNLVVAIESEFNCVLEFEEIFRIVDAETLVQLVIEKIDAS